MRFKKMSFIVMALFVSLLLVLTAVADEPTGGGIAPGDNVVNTETAVSAASLNPFLTTTVPGDYTAAGVGMRGTGSGAITIGDVPAGASVTHAYLYWSILDFAEGPSFANGSFDGNPITGTLIGTSDDPCWPAYASFNFAYRADVTGFVSGNAVYNLSGFASGGSGSPLLEGASLVVIFDDPAAITTKNVVIYDGSVSITETGIPGSVTSTVNVPAIGAFSDDKTTYIVADGQDIFADETLFNGTSIAQDTASTSDSFNNSDGDIWDTDTYDVSALVSVGDTSIEVGFASTSDCLVHVAQVFSSSEALVQITPIIDIRPGDFPNEIFLHYDQTTKVAILSSATFDAPNELDWYSLTFGHNGTEDSLHLRGQAQVPSCRPRDENGDGFVDLTCRFDTLETDLIPGDTEGILMGVTTNGTPVVGTDSVVVFPGIR